MSVEPLISWSAPEHLHAEKGSDWYWAVGIVTLALAAVTIILGNIITAIFVIAAATALVIHASRPAKIIRHNINDRGVMVDDILYPFLTLESFWIPHDESPAKIILKSRKTFMPYIVIYIDEVDPEDIRRILLRYIAETEHHEPLLKHLLLKLGF